MSIVGTLPTCISEEGLLLEETTGRFQRLFIEVYHADIKAN